MSARNFDRVAMFWARVAKGDGCWTWTGARYVSGYGKLRWHGWAYAHRKGFELQNGPIPEGMQVCHRCDNPACVRGDHLFLGTFAENMADKVAKGRQASGMRARLSPAIVSDMRSAAAAGVSAGELAKRYGIVRLTALRAISGKTWRVQ